MASGMSTSFVNPARRWESATLPAQLLGQLAPVAIVPAPQTPDCCLPLLLQPSLAYLQAHAQDRQLVLRGRHQMQMHTHEDMRPHSIG